MSEYIRTTSSGPAAARKMVSSAGPDSSHRFRMSRQRFSFATSAACRISVSQEPCCAICQADAEPLANAQLLFAAPILLSEHKRSPVIEAGVNVRIGSEKHDVFNGCGELKHLAFHGYKGVLRPDRDRRGCGWHKARGGRNRDDGSYLESGAQRAIDCLLDAARQEVRFTDEAGDEPFDGRVIDFAWRSDLK